MDKFLENIFSNLNDEQKESIYKTLIINGTSDFEKQARVEYFSKRFKSMGENVQIGHGIKIVGAENITVGNNVKIKDNVTLIARKGTYITLGDNVVLNDRVYLDTEHEDPEAYIEIGHDAYIGTGTTLFGHKGLEIGDNVLIAQNVTLTPYSHIFDDPDINIIEQGGHSKKVVIGRDAYIGMRCAIMYSGDIGEGSVIGAGSTVVKPIPPYSVAVGSPAKVIKKREK